jgi:DNA-directed RNA polymerase specialized sigma24 family protein
MDSDLGKDLEDENAAFDQLPEVYAAALRMRDERCTDADIAERLGLEREGVPTLLLLAQAKLAVIRRNC